MITLSRTYPAKRAFITGAAHGLGLAFAIALARDNWKLGLTDVNEQGLKTAADAVSKAGGDVSTYVFDVSSYEDFGAAVNSFVGKFGGIDVGINNAGIGCSGKLQDLPIETFKKVIDINLMGVVYGCHLFVPPMCAQKSGHILNVASAAGFVSAPRMSAYNTSKAGVVALSETLRAELAEDNVLVSVLMPTFIRTNVGRNSEGREDDVRHARMLVEESTLEADKVIEETLARMSARELYIVLPFEAQFLWRFKRLFPDSFGKFIGKEVQRKIDRLDRKSSD